jgi:hypothetical protein
MTLAQDNLLPRGIQSWADIPTSLLRAELSRRQVDQDRPACGSGTIGTYNTPLHVGGLILILVVSVAGKFISNHILYPMPCSNYIFSMRIPDHCQAIPQISSTSSHSLPLQTFWNWCLTCHRFCSSVPYRIHIID